MTLSPATSDLLTLREAQLALRLSKTSVLRLIEERQLPVVRIRRRTFVHRQDLEAFIASCREA